MGVEGRFRLVAGGHGPLQQSTVSCGAACLAVARMLVDAPFARWVITGEGQVGVRGGGAGPSDRFAAAERDIMSRTNRARVLALPPCPPWPRSFGTPPWGARDEIEERGSVPETSYDVHLVRFLSDRSLRATFDRLARMVAPGAPALLYVGSRSVPRHICLLFHDDADLAVYEPSSGQVLRPSSRAFAARRLDLGGWTQPWLIVAPSGPTKALAPKRSRRRRLVVPASAAVARSTMYGENIR